MKKGSHKVLHALIMGFLLCYSRSVCTSVNEVICHGIPDQRELQNGDIVNVDVTAYLGGYHGDLNETFTVGEKIGTYNCRTAWMASTILRDASFKRHSMLCFHLSLSYFQVGEVDDEGKAVIRVAHDCLMKVTDRKL